MPSKKKKYNARFPPARIKKIMQTDEEVGKVAAAVPVIISRSLELFIDSLIEKTATITRSKNAKTLSASHIKQAIHSEKTFDFLRDLVANVPDHQADDEVDGVIASGSGTQERKPRVTKPRKPREEGTRGPGRPRKVKVEEKKEEEAEAATEDDDEETESDEEQKSSYDDSNSYDSNQASQPQGIVSPQHGLGPMVPQGVTSQHLSPGNLPPGPLPPILQQHSPNTSQDPPNSAPSSMYPHHNTSHSVQEQRNPGPPFLPNNMPLPYNYSMHNMAFPGPYPYPPGGPSLGQMPPFVPHPGMPPFMGPGMGSFPPHYMMPGGPFFSPGLSQRPYIDGHPYRDLPNITGHSSRDDSSVPLDMSKSARSQQEQPGGESADRQSCSSPYYNSRHSPSQEPHEYNNHQVASHRSRSPMGKSPSHHSNNNGQNGQDSKQSNSKGSNVSCCQSDNSVSAKFNKTDSDNGDQAKINFPGLSDIMSLKSKPKSSEMNGEDDDYDT